MRYEDVDLSNANRVVIVLAAVEQIWSNLPEFVADLKSLTERLLQMEPLLEVIVICPDLEEAGIACAQLALPEGRAIHLPADFANAFAPCVVVYTTGENPGRGYELGAREPMRLVPNPKFRVEKFAEHYLKPTLREQRR